jgi:hypothetical protein
VTILTSTCPSPPDCHNCAFWHSLIMHPAQRVRTKVSVFSPSIRKNAYSFEGCTSGKLKIIPMSLSDGISLAIAFFTALAAFAALSSAKQIKKIAQDSRDQTERMHEAMLNAAKANALQRGSNISAR